MAQATGQKRLAEQQEMAWVNLAPSWPWNDVLDANLAVLGAKLAVLGTNLAILGPKLVFLNAKLAILGAKLAI